MGIYGICPYTLYSRIYGIYGYVQWYTCAYACAYDILGSPIGDPRMSYVILDVPSADHGSQNGSMVRPGIATWDCAIGLFYVISS